MKVVIDVPIELQDDVEMMLKPYDIKFELSGSRRAKFEMSYSEPVDNALVGLYLRFADNPDPDIKVSVLTIKAT